MKNYFHTCFAFILVLFVLSCSEAVDEATAQDTTAPMTSVSRAGGGYATAQPVTLSCDDGDGSGCAVTYYSTDGTTDLPKTVYSDSDEISIGMGETTLRFYSSDIAGNSEAVHTVVYVTPTVLSVAGGGRYLDPYSLNAYTIARKSDKTVWSWGDNAQGQLGNGSLETNSSTPIQVVGKGGEGFLSDVDAIAAGGRHVLALTGDTSVWAWGDDEFGQLGLEVAASENCGAVLCSSTPALVNNLNGVTAIAAGQAHSLALKGGEVWAWGGNSQGQLGNGQTSNGGFVAPDKVCTAYNDNDGCTPLTNITAIAAGHTHSLALDGTGRVWAWGDNSDGQLGDNNYPNDSSLATEVCAIDHTVKPCFAFLGNVTAIAAGQFHSLALKEGNTIEDNRVLTWGKNDNLQLGNGQPAADWLNSPVPVRVITDQGDGNSFLTGVIAITAGGWHALVRKNDNTVWAWGGNSRGQVGDNNGPEDSSVAVPVCANDACTAFLDNVTALADGVSHSAHSLVLKNGTIWAWGGNDWGQLGDGTTNYSRRTPVQVVPF